MTVKNISSSVTTINVCSISFCERKPHVKGMCRTHYGNLHKYGHAIPRRDWSPEDRIKEIGWTVTPTGCWEWNGSKNEFGYGVITLTRSGMKNKRVHRLVYELTNGVVLKQDEHIMHSCDNPPCVNLAHLSVGTHAENMLDIIKKGRHWWQTRTHCVNGHDLTQPAAVAITKDANLCRICRRNRANKYSRRVRNEKKTAIRG